MPLKPGMVAIKPGQVLNPEGRNHWSYRRDFELAMAQLSTGGTGLATIAYSGRSVCLWCGLAGCSVQAAELGPMHEDCLDLARGQTRGELLARVLWAQALRGDSRAIQQLLARLWPERHRVDLAAVDASQGEDRARAFDSLPVDRRDLVTQALSAVLQGKPELAGQESGPTLSTLSPADARPTRGTVDAPELRIQAGADHQLDRDLADDEDDDEADSDSL